MRNSFRSANVLAVALFFAIAPFTMAQETPSVSSESPVLDQAKLAGIAVDFKAIERIADLCEHFEACNPVIQKITEQNLEMLREARKDGSYRWASFQRVEARRSEKEIDINRVHSEQDLDVAEVTGKRAYSVVVSVPKKRGVFLANSKVFVRDITAEQTSADGTTTSKEIPVGVWVNPGDSHTVPLDEISSSTRAKIRVGVSAGGTKAVASAALLQAGLVDDPLNPYHPAVKRFNAIAAIANEKNPSRGQLKTVAQEAYLEVPGEMEKFTAARDAKIALMKKLAETGEKAGTIALGDATPDVVHEIAEANKLLSGTVEQQAAGRALLEALVMKLSPPVPPVATPAPDAVPPATN